MPTWPSSVIPAMTKMQLGSYNETFPDNIIRTDMSFGPAKVRRRGTAAPTIISGNYFMESSELENFKTFYNDTLYHGSLAFDGVHPVTTAVISARFVGQPQVSKIEQLFNVSVVIEVLP